jgi:hypothetical protein
MLGIYSVCCVGGDNKFSGFFSPLTKILSDIPSTSCHRHPHNETLPTNYPKTDIYIELHTELIIFHSFILESELSSLWRRLAKYPLARQHSEMDYIGRMESTEVQNRLKKLFSQTFFRRNFLLSTLCLLFFIPVILLNSTALLNAKMAADDYCIKLQIQTLGFWDAYTSSIWSGTPTFFSNFFSYLRINFLDLNGLFLALLYMSSVTLVAIIVQRNLKENSSRVFTALFSLLIATLLVNFNLLVPRDNLGAAFISTYGWSTARVVGLNMLIILFLILMNSSSKATILKYFILFALIGTDSALAVTAIGIVFIFKNSNNESNVFRLSKNRVIASLALVLEIVSQLTPGQFSRRRALDMGMREGAPVNFDLQAFNMGKYNLDRLTHESFDLKICVGILLLGIMTALFLKIKTNQVDEDLRILCFATIICGIFTLVASVIAYLQTWHFISVNLLFSLFLFYCGISLGSQLKYQRAARLSSKFVSIFALVVIGFNSILISKNFEESSQMRSTKFDTRTQLSTAIDIPLLSLSGFSITEDLKSDWVRQCYVGISNA